MLVDRGNCWHFIFTMMTVFRLTSSAPSSFVLKASSTSLLPTSLPGPGISPTRKTWTGDGLAACFTPVIELSLFAVFSALAAATNFGIHHFHASTDISFFDEHWKEDMMIFKKKFYYVVCFLSLKGEPNRTRQLASKRRGGMLCLVVLWIFIQKNNFFTSNLSALGCSFLGSVFTRFACEVF